MHTVGSAKVFVWGDKLTCNLTGLVRLFWVQVMPCDVPLLLRCECLLQGLGWRGFGSGGVHVTMM